MIGNSKLHAILKRGELLREAQVWLSLFTPSNRKEILDWIRIGQLKDRGINAEGDVIGYYSLFTSRVNAKKKFNSHYTLEDSGDFYRSMFISVFDKYFIIDAESEKGDEDLFEKYGSNIIGLTDENIEKLIQKTKTHYINELRKILFGA